MKNQPVFTTRRREARSYTSSAATSWGRNRNTVRHSDRKLGPVSSVVIIGMLVLTMGMIYVAQGAKATSYDYEISAANSEISELAARKEDLAVEKARATSIAKIKDSEVAAEMEDAVVTGYVKE